MRASTLLLALVALLSLATVAEAVSADASHILVPDEATCNKLKGEIEGAADQFEKVRAPNCVESSTITIFAITPPPFHSRQRMHHRTSFLRPRFVCST